MSESQPFILSLQALSELREIVHDELDNAMPEPSIEEMGIRPPISPGCDLLSSIYLVC